MANKILEYLPDGRLKVLIRRNGKSKVKIVASWHSQHSSEAIGKKDCKLSPKLKRRFVQRDAQNGLVPKLGSHSQIRFVAPTTQATEANSPQIGRKERAQIACEPRKEGK